MSDRTPYVGEGADGCRRSAIIDREEIDTLDPFDPRVQGLAESAQRWDEQAARLERDAARAGDPVAADLGHPEVPDATEPEAGSELVVRDPTPVVNYATGEVLVLSEATTTDLADARRAASDKRGECESTARLIDRELTHRLDFEGKRSATVGRYKLTGTAPTREVVDGERLHQALTELVEAGALSQEAADEALEVETTYTPRKAKVNILRKHADKRVRDAVAACIEDEAMENRRVTVTPTTGGQAA